MKLRARLQKKALAFTPASAFIFGVELMPRYCDVIVERFVKFKGKSDKVFLIRNGERLTYDDVKRQL